MLLRVSFAFAYRRKWAQRRVEAVSIRVLKKPNNRSQTGFYKTLEASSQSQFDSTRWGCQKEKRGEGNQWQNCLAINNLHFIFNNLSLPPFLIYYLIPALPAVYPFALLWFHPCCQWIAEREAFSVSPSGFSALENSPAHSSGNRSVVDKAESWDDIHGAQRDWEHQGHLPGIAQGSVTK